MLFVCTSVYILHTNTIYNINLITRHWTGAGRKQHPTQSARCIKFHKWIQAK